MELSASHRSVIKNLRADCGVEDLSINPEATIKAMDKRYILSSSRQALSALRKVYPTAKKFEEEIKARYTKYRALDRSQQPTQKQADNFVSWDNIVDFRDQYYKDMNATQRLLLALYTYIPPVRADYTPMRVVNRKPSKFEDGHNYLVWNSQPYFIFHAYKTAVRYGDKYVKIPTPLKKELTAYLNINTDNEYLFESNGKPWSPTRLGAAVRKIFQQYHQLDTGINLIRHAYLTKYHAGQKPLEELEKVASAMMHGPMLSQAYRFISLE
jgi:hypothetical protein